MLALDVSSSGRKYLRVAAMLLLLGVETHASAEGSEELAEVEAYYEEEAELYDGVDGDEIIEDDMGAA